MVPPSFDPLGLVAQMQELLAVLRQQFAQPDAPLRVALIEDLASLRGVYLEVIATRPSANVLHSAACIWRRAHALHIGRGS